MIMNVMINYIINYLHRSEKNKVRDTSNVTENRIHTYKLLIHIAPVTDKHIKLYR